MRSLKPPGPGITPQRHRRWCSGAALCAAPSSFRRAGVEKEPSVELTEEEQQKAGVTPDMVRLCIGIEHIDDILTDLDQALAAATA